MFLEVQYNLESDPIEAAVSGALSSSARIEPANFP